MSRRWKPWEIDHLIRHANEGAQAIAKALARSVRSVEVQASKLGISLRKRWHCPKCGHYTLHPLSVRTGWCRACSIEDSRDSAALTNRNVYLHSTKEEMRVRQAERDRQALYSDTNKKRKKLCRFCDKREVKEKSQVEEQK